MLMTKRWHHIDFAALLGLHKANIYTTSYIGHNEELCDMSAILDIHNAFLQT